METKRLIMVAVGGQGNLLASKILGEAALLSDIPVRMSEIHGMAQRGGVVESAIVLGAAQSPIISDGNADILLGFEASEGIKNLPMLREGGLCILNKPGKGTGNPSLDAYLDNKEIHLYTLDADRIASEIGSPLSANMVLLGFFSYFGKPIFSFTKLKEYIEHSSPARFLEFNRKALKLGQLEAKNLNHKGVS